MASSDLCNFEHFANQIENQLWLGSEEAGAVSLEELQQVGISLIVIPAYTGFSDVKRYPDFIHYYQRYVPDISEYPFIPLWPDFIRVIEAEIEKGGSVLVHCAAGKSRSATLVMAYLMKKYQWDFPQAFHFVKKKRPQIATKFEAQLKLWHQTSYSIDDDRIPQISKFNQDGK